MGEKVVIGSEQPASGKTIIGRPIQQNQDEAARTAAERQIAEAERTRQQRRTAEEELEEEVLVRILKDRALALLFKLVFQQENELRALKGQQLLTAKQFRKGVKQRLAGDV